MPKVAQRQTWVVIIKWFKLQDSRKPDYQHLKLLRTMVGWILWDINLCRLVNAKSRLYIYSKYIWFLNILYITFLNEPELIFFICTQWNRFQYFYQTQFHLLQIICLLCITNNSVKHKLFVYTQLNDQTVLFLTIQFSMSFGCSQFESQTDLSDQ